jgi:N-acetylglucosaminyl-diphospho-decaprenol L-rhamnosyltransferase
VDCLESIQEEVEHVPSLRVVVADNDSGDDSVRKIAAAIETRGWGAWAQLLPLPRNGGFAYANNAALRPALEQTPPPRFFFLLNPDTWIKPGAVRALIGFMQDHPRAGIAGSHLEGADGSTQLAARRFPTVLSEVEDALRLGIVSRLLARWVVAPATRDEAHRTDWVCGASMMIRRELFDAVGMLDEGYFMYYEEVDFCRRARTAGFECWYAPQSRVVHLVGRASDPAGDRPPPRRAACWFESRRRYFLKHHGRLRTLLADVAWMLGHGLWRLRRRVQGKADPCPPALAADFFRHSVLCRGFRIEAAPGPGTPPVLEA